MTLSDGAAVTGRYAEWLSMLDTFSVQFLALDRQRDSEMLQLIRSRPDWTVDFEDQEGILFVRTGVTRAEAFSR